MVQIAMDKYSFLGMVPNVSKTDRFRQEIAINNFAKVKTLTFSPPTWLLPASEAGIAENRILFKQGITKIYSFDPNFLLPMGFVQKPG